MLRSIWLLVMPLALVCGSCGQRPTDTQELGAVPDRPVSNAFPTAAEVRLFVNDDYDEDGKPLFSNPAGRSLSASQRAEFESALRVHTTTPDESFAMCFIPHHFFRYYDKNGEQVGEVEVCFCCAGVQASGASNIPLTEDQILRADYDKLKTFVRSLGERTDVQCD